MSRRRVVEKELFSGTVRTREYEFDSYEEAKKYIENEIKDIQLVDPNYAVLTSEFGGSNNKVILSDVLTRGVTGCTMIEYKIRLA